MKKVYVLMICLILSLNLVGCGSQSKTGSPEEKQASAPKVEHPPVSGEQQQTSAGPHIPFDQVTKILSDNKVTDHEEIFGMIENSAGQWDAISREDRIQVTKDLFDQFKKGTYLNDDAILKNLYFGALAAKSYSREYKMQTPADSKEAAYDAMCISLYRNLKFVYRGIEAKDSQTIKDNEKIAVDAEKTLR